MRHALITPLASRDGSVDKDERLVNCYGEQDPVTKETFVFKRAGIDEGDAVITGNDFYGQGAFSYGDDLFVIIDDILFKWDYVGGLDYGGDWVYVFGSQSGAGGAGGGGYYTIGSTQDYDISVTYDIGDDIIYEGKIYYSNSDNNIGNNPETSPFWSETKPSSSRYQGTLSAGGIGDICASRDAAGFSAYLLYPYQTCATKAPGTGLWIEYVGVAFDGVWRIYGHQWAAVICGGFHQDNGVAHIGTIAQVA